MYLLIKPNSLLRKQNKKIYKNKKAYFYKNLNTPLTNQIIVTGYLRNFSSFRNEIKTVIDNQQNKSFFKYCSEVSCTSNSFVCTFVIVVTNF